MKRTPIDMSDERRILSWMIASDVIFQHVHTTYDSPRLFESSFARTVATWIHGWAATEPDRAPGTAIQDLYATHAKSVHDEEDTKAIALFLGSLSKDWSHAVPTSDAWAREQYQSIPAEKRRLITSHDAFGYHAAHYGVQFLAPQGVSTESEPSAKEVARLIKQIKRDKIKAIFMENMSSPKLLAQLARDAGVSPAGNLYADALSAKDGPASDYLAMMRYNVQQILAGLRAN